MIKKRVIIIAKTLLKLPNSNIYWLNNFNYIFKKLSTIIWLDIIINRHGILMIFFFKQIKFLSFKIA